MSEPEIRPAATVILIRDPAGTPAVLMGQRGRDAVFMPSKFVFPGGAVDAGDELIEPLDDLDPVSADRLAIASGGVAPNALAAAAIRELHEEAGLVLGRSAAWSDPPQGWAAFAAAGYRPSANGLSYVFRAVTPPGRPRRFDARFFAADAGFLAGGDHAFEIDGELSRLRWIPIAEAADLDLPFITAVVLAEVARRLPDVGPPPDIPFFRHGDEDREILRLGGRSPLEV